ncbi:MAG TPA: MauE/DoxX family redox-associated membrane protein [Ktedonobacteraceae bacterium]|nr:MauE/DoxX family redox-associated membrane protein [Ktedonobacteraceae bacterium]
MNTALLIARLLLAAVFLVAGFGKLADLAGSRQALRDFGVPAVLANPFGVLLPLAELAVAVALIPLAFAWWGALGALALLLLFVAGIGYNLTRGRTPDCHCFGQIHSAPAGWPTLIRNVILAAIAGFIVWQGRTNAGTDIGTWFGTLAVAQRVELIVGTIIVALIALEAWALFQGLSQQGRLLLRIEALENRLANVGRTGQPSADTVFRGLPVNTQAPNFSLSGLHGETLTLDALRAQDKPVVLVFSDPGCGPCSALLPEVGRWQRDYAGKLTLAIIGRGAPEENRAKSAEHGITQLLLQKESEVAESYQVAGTPSAVLIRTDGTIATPLAEGADDIRGLVAGAIGLPVLKSLPLAAGMQSNGNGGAAMANQPAGQQVGKQAPDFSLPDLSDRTVKLSDFRGEKTLVLFWNPGCGFCQRMLDDLKAWEEKPSEGAPKLLVVSTGSVENNKALGLRSPVLLDQGFSVASRYGANGTPMGVIIDEGGKIASEVAAGALDVLSLARSGNASATPMATM